MNGRAWFAAAAFAAAPFTAFGAGAIEDEPKWSGNIAGYGYLMRDQPDFGVAVASVNRGPLRFEVRHNYEAKGATSAFVGWKFSGGESVTYEVTPLAGMLGGSAHAGIAGLEASVSYKSFDFYTEAEYVVDHDGNAGDYFYSWSELGWRPVEWLRVGLAGQRTRVVDTGRDVQLGAFAQAAFGRATLSLYAFNPEAASRYAVVSLGLSF
jgi:hypothetical protein